MSRLESAVFKGLTFVISKTEDKTINQVISQNGGKIVSDVTKKAHYFVQGYSVTDDDRLGEAHDKQLKVVPCEYLRACVKESKLLDFVEFSLRGGEVDFPTFHASAVQLFVPPHDDCREYEEQPQTVQEFIEMERYIIEENKKVIYLVPLVPKETVKSSKNFKRTKMAPTTSKLNDCLINTVKNFMANFFSLEVKTVEPFTMDINKGEVTMQVGPYVYSISNRKRKGGPGTSLDVMEVISALSENVPADGFCLLGMTELSIYEDGLGDEENLLGRATGDRAGVISFHHCLRKIQSMTEDIDCLQLPGSCTVPKGALVSLLNISAHETLHMFGLDHCPYFSCLMNACSDPDLHPELDPTQHPVVPLHLCPIDVKKMCLAIGFDAIRRYQKLGKFYEEVGLRHESSFIQKLLKIIAVK